MGDELEGVGVGKADMAVGGVSNEHIIEYTYDELLESFVGGIILRVEPGCGSICLANGVNL